MSARQTRAVARIDTAPGLLHLAMAFLGICLIAFALSGHAADTAAAPDNTQVNQRDRNASALTPLDQSNSQTDVRIAATIRDELTDDKSLSVNAHNVKVIVRDGVVTLRGPVASAAEKTRVEAIAKTAPGVNRVDSEIDVKP